MAKIISKGRYENGPRNLFFKRGELFEADGELLQFLQQDAPDNFELWQPEQVAPVVDAPPADKAVKRSKVVRK